MEGAQSLRPAFAVGAPQLRHVRDVVVRRVRGTFAPVQWQSEPLLSNRSAHVRVVANKSVVSVAISVAT
jgi:hypothetical protein